MVTDFPLFKYQRHEAQDENGKRFPVRSEDGKRVVFSNVATAYQDPLVLPKWSNQISASSVHVPLKKTKRENKI